MFNYICMGSLEMQGTQNKREIQNTKFLSTVGFELGTFRLQSRHATDCATRSDIHDRFKDNRGTVDVEGR